MKKLKTQITLQGESLLDFRIRESIEIIESAIKKSGLIFPSSLKNPLGFLPMGTPKLDSSFNNLSFLMLG